MLHRSSATKIEISDERWRLEVHMQWYVDFVFETEYLKT
jgi:hypothetical protein